jgi:diguanylate cyclase (GGDEF)-like protein
MAQPQLDRLLVVEHHANDRERLSQRLTRRGYQVDVAGDGADALEKIGRAEYDLILLDAALGAMPHGPATPGARSLDLLRLLRATHSAADLPVIMLTDGQRNGTVVEALQGGANDYVVRPVDLPVMTARIEEQLSRSKIGRQRKSERHIKAHPQRHHEGRWMWDLASNTIQLSARSRALLGLRREEIGNHSDQWMARVHPADVERVRAGLSALVDGQTEEFRSEHRVRNGQGQYEWLLAVAWLERSENGAAARICGTLALQSKPGVDALTGLGTRVLILEQLGAAIARQTPTLALILVELDGVRVINDSFGRATGDRILTKIAGRLQSAVDPQPAAADGAARSLARIRGDEFAILAEGVDRENAATLVESILHTTVQPMTIDGFKISMAASIGVFCGSPGGSAAEDLLRNAYLAMYRAKELGKNCWHLFEPDLRTRARARIATVHDLRYAVGREQLRAYYQPKLNLRTRQITGFEALIRWNHPARGIVYPGEFIELAEDTGLIVPIGEWMLREACGQLNKWQTRFALPQPLTMNVNLSVKQLVDPCLVEQVKSILEETGILPSTLNLELTETALMTNLDGARSALTDLRKLGIRLKLDDFGTGYSSLGYLGALHFDSLKIDRGFVQRMNSDIESHAIVESIAKLAHALGMTMVAEGIELEEHIVELLRMGCEVGQGFYFSTAVEASAAEELIVGSLRGPLFQHSRFREGLC